MNILLMGERNDFGCGAAATRMVLSYFDRYESNIEDELIKNHTTYLRDIKSFFEKRYFKCYYHTKSMSDKTTALEKLERLVNDEWPSIALVNRLIYKPDAEIPKYDVPWIKDGYLGHFVVIREFNSDSVLFNDPTYQKGPITLDRELFDKAFQMYFLSVNKL